MKVLWRNLATYTALCLAWVLLAKAAGVHDLVYWGGVVVLAVLGPPLSERA